MKKIIYVLCSLILTIPSVLSAQKKDSARVIPAPYHKNIIKFNPTPMILWSSKNVTFSYERILNRKQSISISLGYLEFPSLFKDTILNLVAITSRHKYGFNAEIEYRFYMMNRNLRPIPDGLYFAPFVSYYGYHFKNDVDILHVVSDSAGLVKGDFSVINGGVEMGYQFVFWKRFTVDLVLIGPAISYYTGTLNVTGQFDADKVKELHEDLYNKLIQKYPMIGDYVVNKSFSNNGKLDLFSVGFRYLIQLGFHF
jgi:hypothetical protein